MYELVSLNVGVAQARPTAAKASAAIRADPAAGEMLGCWTTDIGVLNQVILLLRFADEAALAESRRLRAATPDPFGCDDMIRSWEATHYAAFPFLPPVRTGSFGAVYEFRTYWLEENGLQPIVDSWEAAIPARVAASPLIIAMAALEGPPRIVHIWPYPSLDVRATIRHDTMAQGIWPPKGGRPWMTGEMHSMIALPAPGSPLC